MRSPPSYRAQAPYNILLVDDNFDGMIARRSVLEELGYVVFAASSAADAIQIAELKQMDLVVTDFRMEPVNGVQLIATLRQKGFTKPIILLSGYAETFGFSNQETGADLVIQKSANEINQLVRGIKRSLTPKKPAARQTHAKAAASRTAK